MIELYASLGHSHFLLTETDMERFSRLARNATRKAAADAAAVRKQLEMIEETQRLCESYVMLKANDDVLRRVAQAAKKALRIMNSGRTYLKALTNGKSDDER